MIDILPGVLNFPMVIPKQLTLGAHRTNNTYGSFMVIEDLSYKTILSLEPMAKRNSLAGMSSLTILQVVFVFRETDNRPRVSPRLIADDPSRLIMERQKCLPSPDEDLSWS